MDAHHVELAMRLLNSAAYFVFLCSLLTIFLSIIEKWANQWFPNSGFAKTVSAITDLVSKFGALNLREVIRDQNQRVTDNRDKRD